MRSPADAREQAKVDQVFQIFGQCNLYRVTQAQQWEEIAQLIWPSMVNTFSREGYNFPGIKKSERQVDATGMVANQKFAAICDSMITPFSSKWHNLESDNPDIQKNRGVRLWFEKANKALFTLRYAASANFRSQNHQIFKYVGAFGNGPLFIDRLYDMHNRPAMGVRYSALPLGEVYIRVNHQGQVDAFVRAYRMTARQTVQKWGEEMLPDELRPPYEKNSETLYDFFHCVYPNTDYDASFVMGVNSKPFISHYVACAGRRIMQEGGYNTFPMAYARFPSEPGNVHGFGPAASVLPALKTLNAQKSTSLKVGHRAADPVFITADDGVSDFNWTPGAQNRGMMSADGKPLVGVIPPGNFELSEEMMKPEQSLIGDVFLTKLFEQLYDPRMTATQVIELINQKGIFLAPTVGGMSSDYLDPMIERELDLAASLGLLDPMPPLLREAKGEYKIVYTSPLFKAARAGEASGFLRTVESALQVAGQMADPSLLDTFSFDRALPDIARIQDVPESWMASDDEIAAKRKQRADQQQQQAQIQALPAQAAMAKAQAYVRKEGGGLPNNGPIQNQ